MKKLLWFGTLTLLCLFPLKLSSDSFKSSSSSVATKLSKEEEKCLAEVIYYESRSESKKGQMAVAFTVLNRVKSPRFPKSICKVVKQSKKKGIYQFSYLADKKALARPKEKKAYEKAKAIAKESVFLHELGLDFTKGSDHYHTKKISPDWARSSKLRKVLTIQNHVFYKTKGI
jgi:spore germination cell wall hydrolase CwlJ-like protein